VALQRYPFDYDTTLAAAIPDAVATSITVTAALPNPGGAFPVRVDTEVMLVTAGFGTVNGTVQRNYDGLGAAAHSNGARASGLLPPNSIHRWPQQELPLTSQPILDVGAPGQSRAGRNWNVQDFYGAGLDDPILVANLADTTTFGTDGRSLTNNGTVPFSAVGIDGTSAVSNLNGATQYFSIANIANDPLARGKGTWAGWFKSPKGGSGGVLMSRFSSDTSADSFMVRVSGNKIQIYGYVGAAIQNHSSATNIEDDNWHFWTMTHDGATVRLYMDGTQDSSWSQGLWNTGTTPLTIGGTWNYHVGQIGPSFIHADVLTLSQIRYLMASKVSHGLGVLPTSVRCNVKRRRKSGQWIATDFPSTPLRLFAGGSITDLGSGGLSLTANGSIAKTRGIGGIANEAYQGGSGKSLSGSDAGLPTTGARSMGIWIDEFTDPGTTGQWIMGYGTGSGTGAFEFSVNSGAAGRIAIDNWSANITTADVGCNDGKPHLLVATYDSAAIDGAKTKLYFDGKLVGWDSATQTTVLGGTLRVGNYLPGAQQASFFFTGAFGGEFITGYAMTGPQIRAIMAKGAAPTSVQSNIGELVGWDASNVYPLFLDAAISDAVDIAVLA
jgi:hypothetical protein